jgi:hypothetical protein
VDHEPWEDVAERYGATGEGVAWKAVVNDYHWDRLTEAYEEALSLGTGTGAFGIFTVRMIEAEFATRQLAQRRQVNDWLEIEWIEGEVPLSFHELRDLVIGAADKMCAQFGWTHGPKTLVTVLARGANAPWAPGRHGFCVDKHPYDKICLPGYLTDDLAQLDEAMRHEYAHVMTLNRSNAQVPIWLDEAIAMRASSGMQGDAKQMFARGTWPWLSHEELGAAFRTDRESSAGQNLVWRGYQQSAAIGEYLGSTFGDRELGRLMDGFANNSVVADFLMRLRGREPVEEALREVYRFGVRELWVKAREWVNDTAG